MKIGNLEVYGIIYKIINTLNNKVYIGQTTRSFNERYSAKGEDIDRVYNYYLSHKNNNRNYNVHLLNSIDKYGFKNFRIIKEFDYAFSKEELNIKEACWIDHYKATDVNYGYNNRDGGANGKLTKEAIKASSISKLGFDIDAYKEDIISIYLKDDNLTQKEISELYGVSEGVIQRLLKENNVPIRTCSETKIGFNMEDEKENVIKMYTIEKQSILGIADSLKVSTSAVLTNLKKWNVQIKSNSEGKLGFDINLHDKDIIEMYMEDNLTIEEIARKFGVTAPAIKHLFKRNRVRIKSLSESLIGFNMEDEKENVIKMYTIENKTQQEISDYYDISSSTISEYLKKWEIKKEQLEYNKTTAKAHIVTFRNIETNDTHLFSTVEQCARWMVENHICANINNAKTRIHDCSKHNKIYKNKYKIHKEENPNDDIYQTRNKSTKPIFCIEKELCFDSIKNCALKLQEIFGIKMSPESISRAIHLKKQYNGYTFKFISDLTEEEYIKYDIENKIKEIQENAKLNPAI